MSLCLVPSTCLSKDVTLSWQDSNSVKDLAGYKLFVREAGEVYDYRYPEWEGMQSSCTVSGLDEYESYYFIVRVVHADGTKSSDSNEVHLPAASDGSAALDNNTPSGGGSSGCFIYTLSSH